MGIAHSEVPTEYSVVRPPMVETDDASGETKRDGAITAEKEAELAALDKELESAFWKLDYLKRNDNTERIKAAQAAQRHIGFMRELLAERGQGSVVNDILEKGFLVRIECDPSDFGRLAVTLESKNLEEIERGMKAFEDVFGEFDHDAHPSKESLKNAFYDAYKRFATIRRKHPKKFKSMEAGGTIH